MAEGIVDGGEVNPLDAYIRLKALQKAIKEALNGLEPAAMDEADRYGGPDDRVRLGVNFDVRTTYIRYDYSHDARREELKAREKAIKKQRKEREKQMKALMEASMESDGTPASMANMETGEVLEPARIKTSKQGLVVTFPRE